MQVSIDGDRCTGHGRCYMLAPEVFDADVDGYGVVRDEVVVVPPELEAAARRAAANCPEDAITLRN